MSRRAVGTAILLAATIAFVAAAWAAVDPARSGLALLLVAFALVAGGAAWLELGAGSAKEVALVATLGGVAAAGRVLFAAIPGVQPVTVIAIASGAALGPRAGAGVGATAAFASNLFMGQGIWTPWQMLAWGACGAAGGLARRLVERRLTFAVLAFALGLAFSSAMDVWEWYSFFPHTWEAFAVLMSRGVPFDLAHAVGNVVLVAIAGPELRRVLERYGKSLHTEIDWSEPAEAR